MQSKLRGQSLPNTFSVGSAYRLVMHLPDFPSNDFERLEDLVADGLQALRRAVEDMLGLPSALVCPLQPAERTLRLALEKRQLLSEETRGAIERWLEDAERFGGEHAGHPAFASSRQGLQAALAASDHVLDLLAAEREVARQRGL